MTHGRLARYVDDLARELRARDAYRHDLVDEVRDHLLDSVEAGERRGLSTDAAEDDALARVGAPDVVARHAAATVPRVRRGLLLTLCACTVGAVGYLSLSLLILRPPHASRGWPAEAAVALVVTSLTFAWTKAGGLAPWLRPVLVLGAITLGVLGALSIYAAATREFEGYGVLLGTLFAAQAITTLLYLTPGPRRVARR